MSYAALDEINDDETDGLELEQSDDLRFSLVGRFITDKTVKFLFMRDTMATVWKPVKGMAAKEIAHNTFLFQFFHDLDVKRVLDDGPWAYEQSLLVFARIQPDVSPLSMQIDTAEFWIQIHDLPTGFFSEKSAKAIGDFIGKFIRFDEDNYGG